MSFSAAQVDPSRPLRGSLWMTDGYTPVSPRARPRLGEFASPRARPVRVLPAMRDLQPPRQPLRAEPDADAAHEADFHLRFADEADAEAGDVGDGDLAGRGVVVVAEED